MQTLERLSPSSLRAAVVGYRDLLRAHQDRLNRLNVYPVPDGDTGTNMALTLESVVVELARADDMVTVCRAISRGSLMGARGNSGVILSQVLRGVADELKGLDEVGPGDVAAGLTRATEKAYGAVVKPVEGTILTVLKAAAVAAETASGTGRSLVDVLDATRSAAAEALARTPELLPVLKQAGVVDAGGAGLCLLIDALLHVAAGRPLPEPPAAPVGQQVAQPVGQQVPGPIGQQAPGADRATTGPRFEVMHLLEAPDDAIPVLKSAWAAVGDSIVVVGGDGTWNCHVHTDDIGAVLEAAVEAGRPRAIRVSDLYEQVAEEQWVREATAGVSPSPATATATATATTAVVAVAAGAGAEALFGSLGVQAVVAGGQSMNPSTAQLLEAVEAVPADAVVLLPDNGNIVAVAGQVDALTGKRVHVLPTRSVPEGLAAASAYDPGADLDANVVAMGEAASLVVTGEVTRAVRASHPAAGPIAEGDWLGIGRHGIEIVASSAADALTGLLAKLLTDDQTVVTLLVGEAAETADVAAMTGWLAEHRPSVGVEVHDGGQPLYPYLFGLR